jgi:putative ABC transport system ATP-binding protein
MNQQTPFFPGSCDKPLIELINVVKTYKTAAGDFVALKEINACFNQGEFISIIGKSGSGKSTLLNMMTGIDHPSAGAVRIGDVSLVGRSEGALSVWRGKTIGIVFQFFQLLPMLSLLENTMLPMDFCNMYPVLERAEHAMELLRSVGLQDFAHKHPGAISGGQQQLAAIARALANDPPILIADEPTGNLDSKTTDMVLNIFNNLVRNGKTILIVTHDKTVARRAGRILVLADGELIDETVVKAFPDLSHRAMLDLTHRLTPLHLDAWDGSFQDLSPSAGLILVTAGKLVLKSGTAGKSVSGDLTLSAGDFFSRYDPLFSSPGLHAASQSGLDLKTLSLAALDAWSHSMSEILPILNRVAVTHKTTARTLSRSVQAGV